MSWATAGALFAVALFVHLPFRVEHLWAHDSVLYARAIEDFDPAAQRPHPPGYLWYVLLARGLTAVTGDPNDAMTLISAVAGAAAVALLYVLGRRMYDERTGVIAALFLMTSVTFWGESAVAYPYTLLAALATGVALLLWTAPLALASLAWGIAIGFRTDLAFALAPVWLIAAWSAPMRARLAGAVAAAIPSGVWLLATGAATPGGLGAFLDALRAQTAEIEAKHSVFARGPTALAENAWELARYLGRGLYFVAPLLAALVISRDIQRVELRETRRTLFALAWALAPIPFFLFVHVGEYGHAFSALPGLCLLGARGAIGLVRAAQRPRALRWVAGSVAIANALIFLMSDTPLSAQDLARRDSGIGEKIAALRSGVDAEQTVVLTAYDQLIIEHYLPDLHKIAYEPQTNPDFTRPVSCRAACGQRVTVVVWDDILRTEGAWRAQRMKRGSQLRFIETTPGSFIVVRDRHRVAITSN